MNPDTMFMPDTPKHPETFIEGLTVLKMEGRNEEGTEERGQP